MVNVQLNDSDVGMIFEGLGHTVFDVGSARRPPDLLAFRLSLARRRRLGQSFLVGLGYFRRFGVSCHENDAAGEQGGNKAYGQTSGEMRHDVLPFSVAF
jgi:hypothetical protein